MGIKQLTVIQKSMMKNRIKDIFYIFEEIVSASFIYIYVHK